MKNYQKVKHQNTFKNKNWIFTLEIIQSLNNVNWKLIKLPNKEVNDFLLLNLKKISKRNEKWRTILSSFDFKQTDDEQINKTSE